MGIQGLLPFLKGIQRDVHVSSFRGRKVAIDGYCWLHKGAYSCPLQLVMKTEKLETLPFIKYCMKRVNMLLRHDITPVMVFDGSYLPLKAATEKERRERRQVYCQRGKDLLKEGKKSEAVDCFQKSVDVSPEMALALIKECRSAGVECIVAPYEADSQLAYLSKEGIVDLVITEDSDLIVFGCRKVLFKLGDSGNGKLIEIDQLGKANHGLVGFTVDSFRHMCILSGCDYLASVPGIGLGKALKLMKRFKKDPYRVIKALHHENGKVPENYEENFCKADQTFLYQMVFDPRTQAQVRLNPLPSDVDVTDFAGVHSSPRKAVGMARGNINPLNYAVMDTYSPSKAAPAKSRSWGGSVIGGSAGWGRPTDTHPPSSSSSLISSHLTRKHFKPPKKLKPKPAIDDGGEVKDEDLQTVYLTASMAPSTTHSTTSAAPTAEQDEVSVTSPLVTENTERIVEESKSRFFSEGAADSALDETPSDLDVTDKLRAKRRLALMPRGLGGNAGLRSSLSPSRDDLETPTQSVEEVTPPGRGRKRQGSDSEHSIRASLQGFQYSSLVAKKVRRCSDSSPLSQLDQDPSSTSVPACAPSLSPSPVKNPFAKNRISLREAPRVSQDSMEGDGHPTLNGLSEQESALSHTSVFPGEVEESCDGSIQSLPCQASTDISSTTSSAPPSITASATVSRGLPFMTSEDFITTRPPSLLNHVTALAQSGNGPDNRLSGHPTSTSQGRVLSLGNAGKRKSRTKVVSKTSVNSKFKAPKRSVPSEQGGLTQLNLLSQFGYCSRPQMRREH